MKMEFINDYYIKGYLTDQLSEEEVQAFEQAMEEQPLLKEVIEGLRPLSALEIELHVKELQKTLNNQLILQRKKRNSMAMPWGQQWVWILTALILLGILLLGMYMILGTFT